MLRLKQSFTTAGVPSQPSIVLQAAGPCAVASRPRAAEHSAGCPSAAAQGNALTTALGTADGQGLTLTHSHPTPCSRTRSPDVLPLCLCVPDQLYDQSR